MAKKTPTPLEGTVVDGPTEEQQLITTEGDKLRTFLGGALQFFAKARGLERSAKEQLDVARQLKLKPPKTQAEDEKVQVVLRAAKLARKTVNETWGITQVLSQLHKRTVAGRERAGAMLDEAAEITQSLHNDWTREQTRIAREKEEAKRREEEAKERARRDAEQAELEAEAARAEAASPVCSEREQDFVDLVFNDLNTPVTAARSVGYKDPELQADRLMKSPKILAAIEAKRTAAAIRQQAEARRAVPIEVQVERERPAVTRVGGGFDRSTHTAVVDDPEAFLAAMLDPRTRTQLGIPADVATFLQPKMNEYARSLKGLINKWPGVRYVENKNTVSR